MGVGALVAACGPTQEERAKRAADSIVAIADSGGLVFRGAIAGAPVAIMLRDCKAYNLDDAHDALGRRSAVVKPDFYPWPTACMRQSISGDADWVTVTVGRQGVGAGGCCATGGTSRSKDGRAWERQRPYGKWEPVVIDTAQPPVADTTDSTRTTPR